MVAVPRDAATVVLVRPRDGAYDVLLTRRPASMTFMGGAFVFPGGALDDVDSSDEMAERSVLTRDEAAARLGEPIDAHVALGLFCCAVRELFEETGILLAADETGRPVDPALVREVYAPRRVEIGGAPHRFASFLRHESLRLATNLLTPHARLITPERSPIRFDARFFVAPLPEGQTVVPHPTEVEEWRWVAPIDAISLARDGAIDVPIPTMAVLQGLAETPDVRVLLARGHESRVVATSEHSHLVTSVIAPNPSLMTLAGTNTYVVGRNRLAIVDPGVADPVFIRRVAREAGRRGKVELILLTHLHIDHIGGVVPLATELRVPVAAFSREAPLVSRHLDDGERIELGEATLLALHTPGHSPDHLCYFLEEERAVFAGDVVAGYGTVVIHDLIAYMATLERLRALEPRRIYPGHGPVVEDAVAKLEEYLTHRQQREEQILEALRAGASDIPTVVERVYADTPQALHVTAQASVRAHLEKLEQENRVVRSGEKWTLRT